MRHRIPFAIAALTACAALAAPASAGETDTIQVGDDFYDPEKYSGSIFTDVHWLPDPEASDEHNVVATGKLFDSGPLVDDTDYTIGPSAGTFAYFCESHGTRSGRGMAGTLKIPPVEGATKRGEQIFGVQWADGLSTTGDRYDVRYMGPGTNGKYKTWIKNTSEVEAVFGQGNDPVDVKPNKPYRVQVRSEDSSDPKKEKSGLVTRPEVGAHPLAQRPLRVVRAPTRSSGINPSRSAFTRWPLRP